MDTRAVGKGGRNNLGSICTTPTQCITLLLHASLLSDHGFTPHVEHGPEVKGFSRSVKELKKWREGQGLGVSNLVKWGLAVDDLSGRRVVDGCYKQVGDSIEVWLDGAAAYRVDVSPHVNAVALETALGREPGGVPIGRYLVDPAGVVEGLRGALARLGYANPLAGGGGGGGG
ncbi:hypothetical protein TrRE_jg13241, partial [Triparma retinervis]